LQLAYPLLEGGANSNSLVECQRQFARTGACEPRFVGNVREPDNQEARDVGWRKFDSLTDPHLDIDSPEDDRLWESAPPEANLYYWQPGYWLAGRKPQA
jgi:hypothetical protein